MYPSDNTQPKVRMQTASKPFLLLAPAPTCPLVTPLLMLGGILMIIGFIVSCGGSIIFGETQRKVFNQPVTPPALKIRGSVNVQCAR